MAGDPSPTKGGNIYSSFTEQNSYVVSNNSGILKANPTVVFTTTTDF